MVECIKSKADSDPKVQRLITWVRDNGGICEVETRIDIISGARGLYTIREISNDEEPIVQIPNKLIISPLKVTTLRLDAEKGNTFKEVFELSPKLFDAKFPYEVSE